MKRILIGGSVLLGIILIIVIFWINFPIKHKSLIVKYSAEFGLSDVLVASVINAESGFDDMAVSSVGAIGLMQVMPTTASEVAGKLGIIDYDLTQADTNIRIGCYYLKLLLNMYDGDLIRALSAYNAGYNNVNSWDFDGKVDNIPVPATKIYVNRILSYLRVYEIFYF